MEMHNNYSESLRLVYILADGIQTGLLIEAERSQATNSHIC